MPELLPCPFCGGDAEVIYMFENCWVVACKNEECLVWEGRGFRTEQKAVETWNTRTPQKEG